MINQYWNEDVMPLDRDTVDERRKAAIFHMESY